MKLTKADIIKYLTLIQAEFPSKELDSDTQRLRAEMWYKVLSEYTKEEVDTAVYEAITNCEFAPKVKDILDICKRNRNPYAISPQDLWNEVLGVLPRAEEAVKEMKLGNSRAWDYRIQDYGKLTHYERGWQYLNKIFQRLRPEIKRYFGNCPERLSRIAKMDAGDLDFEKARFMKAIQPFMEQQAIADKNGMGDFFELTNDTKKAIADKRESEGN